jgi:hypothetical protein
MKPIDRAALALEGLSIGDAFAQMFFGKEDVMLSDFAIAPSRRGLAYCCSIGV